MIRKWLAMIVCGMSFEVRITLLELTVIEFDARIAYSCELGRGPKHAFKEN